MIRQVLFLLGVCSVVCIQCYSDNSKPPKKKMLFEKVFIKEIEATFKIPTPYTAYTLSDYERLLKEKINDSLSLERQLHYINTEREKQGNTAFFVNPEQPLDFIAISYGQMPVMKINPYLKQAAISSAEYYMDTVLVKKTKLLSYKEYQNSEFDYTKIRYRQKLREGNRFHTSYLVMTPKYTFTVDVMNRESKDYQSLIDKLELK